MIRIKLFEELSKKKPKVIIFQGSPRDKDTCPNMESKTHTIVEYVVDKYSDLYDFDVIDLSVNQSKKSIIQPCKGCVSTAGGYHCHWYCISGDQRVHTIDGFKPISELNIGDILQDNNRVLRKVKTSDSEDIFELKINDGRKIELTSNHKVKLLSKDRYRDKGSNWEFYRKEKWTEVKNIKVGDNIPYIEIDNLFKYDINPDDNLYKIFGLIWGDGTFANNTPLLYIEESQSLFIDEITNNFNDEIISILPHNVSKNNYISDRNVNYLTKMVKINFGTRIGKKMISLFKKENAKTRRLNIENFKTKTQIVNFINGWISTDGTISKDGVVIYNVSYDCLRDAQLLLSRIGVRSNISDNRHLFTEVKGRKLSRACSLSILDKDSFNILFENLHLINPYKRNKIENINKNSRRNSKKTFSKVKSIKYLGKKPVFDIEVENSHEFNCEGVKVHNCTCYKKDDEKKPDFMYDGDIYTKLEECDAFLVFSPIHWYSVSSQVKALFDRLVCASQTLHYDDAIKILGKGNLKNSEITGKFAQSGEYNELLKNHLEGKVAGFYIHGDDGANDYDGKELPDSFKDENFTPKQSIAPIVNQCRYSGINVPNDLIEAFYINKDKDYYTSNLDLENLSKPFDNADRLLENLKKYI